MTFVHPVFSAVRKMAFTSQYREFFDRSGRPPRKWLGILNMIFAIGCCCSKRMELAFASHENGLVFLSRAWKLSMESDTLLEHADLQQTQLEFLEFLIAVYLLCLGQVNRASTFCGLALQSALSLGINLRLRRPHPQRIQRSSLSPLMVHILPRTLPNLNARPSLRRRRIPLLLLRSHPSRRTIF